MNAIKSLVARPARGPEAASLSPGIIDSDRRRLERRRGAAERWCVVRYQLICRHDSVCAPQRLRQTVRPSAVRNITLFPSA